MKLVTLTSGFEAELDEAALDDMELFDAIADLEGGNKLALSAVASKLLGEQQAALYDHFRDERGRVPIGSVMGAIHEIVEQLGGKNS